MYLFIHFVINSHQKQYNSHTKNLEKTKRKQYFSGGQQQKKIVQI